MEDTDVLLLMKDQQKYCYVTTIQHQDILLECTKVRIIINNNTERESVCCLCNSVLFCWVVQFMTVRNQEMREWELKALLGVSWLSPG